VKGFAAIVLAGGGGRRLGDPAKPERPVGGVPMVSRVLAAVADAAPRIVVGPARLGPLLPADATVTTELPPGAGPVAAVGAGLAAITSPADLVAVLAADLPFLTVEAVALLRDTVAVGDRAGAILVDADDRPQWLCGVWRREALVARLAEVGELAGRSLREVLGPLTPALVSPVARADRGADPPAYFDCDTEQDLRRAEEWTHGSAGDVDR
jgi:molybdopterin-guanine dinucleotide biosynthesis protein A